MRIWIRIRSQPKLIPLIPSARCPSTSVGQRFSVVVAMGYLWIGRCFFQLGGGGGFSPGQSFALRTFTSFSTALQERDAEVAFKMKSSTGYLSFLTVQMLHGALTLALCRKLWLMVWEYYVLKVFFSQCSSWYSQCEARLLLYFSLSLSLLLSTQTVVLPVIRAINIEQLGRAWRRSEEKFFKFLLRIWVTFLMDLF